MSDAFLNYEFEKRLDRVIDEELKGLYRKAAQKEVGDIDIKVDLLVLHKAEELTRKIIRDFENDRKKGR